MKDQQIFCCGSANKDALEVLLWSCAAHHSVQICVGGHSVTASKGWRSTALLERDVTPRSEIPKLARFVGNWARAGLYQQPIGLGPPPPVLLPHLRYWDLAEGAPEASRQVPGQLSVF